LFLLVLPTHVQAQPSRWYFGADIWKFDDADTNVKGLDITLGYDLNNFISLQGIAGPTESEDISPTLDERVNYVGAYLRGNLRYERTVLYGLAGYSYFKLSGSYIDALKSIGLDDDTTDGGGVGLGMELHGSEDTAINILYMKHYLDDDAEAKTLRLDPTDEILKGCLITRDGAIVHPQFAP